MKQVILNDQSHHNPAVQATGFQRDPGDTKDFGRVVLGGGYAGVPAPTNPRIALRP